MSHTRLVLSTLQFEAKPNSEVTPLNTHLCSLQDTTLCLQNLLTLQVTQIEGVKGFISVVLNRSEGVVYYTKTSIIFHQFNGIDQTITESLSDEKLILHPSIDSFINYALHSSLNYIFAVLTMDKKLHLFIPRMPCFSVTLDFLKSLPKTFSFTADLEYFAFLYDTSVVVFHNVNSKQMTSMKLHEVNDFFQVAAVFQNSSITFNVEHVNHIFLSKTSLLCICKDSVEIFNIENTQEKPLISSNIKSATYLYSGNCGSMMVLEDNKVVCYIHNLQVESVLRGMVSSGFEFGWNKLVENNDVLKYADRKMVEFENAMRNLHVDEAKRLLLEMREDQIPEIIQMVEKYYDSGVEKKMYYRDLSMISEIGLQCVVKYIHNKSPEFISKTSAMQRKYVEAILLQEDMVMKLENVKMVQQENLRKSGNFGKVIERGWLGLVESLKNGNFADIMKKYGMSREEVKEYGMKFVYQLILANDVRAAIHLLIRLGYKDVVSVLKEVFNKTNCCDVRKELKKMLEIDFEITEDKKKYFSACREEKNETVYFICMKNNVRGEEPIYGDMSSDTMQKYGISYNQKMAENIASIDKVDNIKGNKLSLSIDTFTSTEDVERCKLLQEEGVSVDGVNSLEYLLIHGDKEGIINYIERCQTVSNKEAVYYNRFKCPKSVEHLIKVYFMNNPTENILKEAEQMGLSHELTRLEIIGGVESEITPRLLELVQLVIYLPIFDLIMSKLTVDPPQNWMKQMLKIDTWDDELEIKAVESKIPIQMEEVETCEMKELYEALMKTTYAPMSDKMPFPVKEIPQYTLSPYDMLSDGRVISMLQWDYTFTTEELMRMDSNKEMLAAFVMELKGNTFTRVNLILKDVLSDDPDFAMVSYDSLDESEYKHEALCSLERKAVPFNSASHLRNFLGNKWGEGVSLRQLDLISESENLIGLFEFGDQHGYSIGQVDKSIRDNWPETPIKSHIISIDSEINDKKSLGVVIEGFSNETESGVNYMNWVFIDKSDSEQSLLRYLESIIAGKTLKSAGQYTNLERSSIEGNLLKAIATLLSDNFSCENVIQGLYFFDPTNPLIPFMKILKGVSVALFGQMNDLRRDFENAFKRTWGIGSDEFLVQVMLSSVEQFCESFSKLSDSVMRLVKELEQIANLPAVVKRCLQNKKAIIEVIEKHNLSNKLTCLSKNEEVVNLLIETGSYVDAHDFAMKFVPDNMFLPVIAEISMELKKRNWSEDEKWEKIDQIVQKRQSRPIDAGEYYYKEAVKLHDKEDYETNYQTIANRVLTVLQLSKDWFTKMVEKDAMEGLKKVEKMRHIYEESKMRNIAAVSIEKPKESSVYYLTNRGDYTPAMLMNEKLNCPEMRVFKQVYEFVVNENNYSMTLTEGLEHLDVLVKGALKIARGLELMKMRYTVIHKYYEEKLTILALLRDSSAFASKRLDVLSAICGVQTLKKYSIKLTHWPVIFEEAKKFIEWEGLTDEEIVPLMCKIYIDVAEDVKPISINGYPSNIIKSFLGLLKDPTRIVELLLSHCELSNDYFVVMECFACCYFAGEMTTHSEVVKTTIETIYKVIDQLLLPQNISSLLRFAVKTKTLPEFVIKQDEECVSLPKMLLQRVFNNNIDHQQVIPSIEEKSCFENLIYYISDLNEVQKTPNLDFHSNYEEVFSDCYTVLNTSMEGGMFYFEKAKKVVTEFINEMTNVTKTTPPIYMWYAQFVEALKGFARAIGFFRNQEEYYWANQCVNYIGILSLQIYFDNVQLIGLTQDKAQHQLVYFSSFDDAYMFATFYNLFEPLKWSKALYHQCITSNNLTYLNAWLNAFTLDKPTLTDILEQRERDEKSSPKRKDVQQWDVFLSKIRSVSPSLLYFCQSRPLTKTLTSELKIAINAAFKRSKK
ncbi:hypothetical protein EIN_046470 [Entamoeba invadens IP1]|uniref:Spatacsin C-terminal domain-containing protein n=1 Tax=Entamoeba invadens IP1 TaxID=370355 RepID=A0A0A1UD89_ENTIV|nr:hypothetical protein EIN_046470 [Entamoeba invadens IP1]ELP94404.1 hypothetical protein EIN_046470 [Entamoeba invadens IP1]|eukprot:XP_004261175.1 hypothetical protein EIN_046470 [Entamoeba invadens IP1]